MAEIKIGDGLSGEIDAFRSAGSALNSSAQSAETPQGASLDTCRMYADQHQAIQSLIALYRQLVIKDAGDLARLAQEMRDLDQQIAGNT